MSKKSSRTFVSRETRDPSATARVEATTRRGVMGGECTESASARHALTTGGDAREIERRSFAVRAEDVMGNMRPSVFVQYAKLLRRYCNNFRNKNLSPHSLPFIRDVEDIREQRTEKLESESIYAIMYQ